MSDRVKQFKNELIDLLGKHNVAIVANIDIDEIDLYVFGDRQNKILGILGTGAFIEIDKNTPKEDI